MAEEVQPASDTPLTPAASTSPAPAPTPVAAPVPDPDGVDFFDVDAEMAAHVADQADTITTPAGTPAEPITSPEPAPQAAAPVTPPQQIPLQLRMAARRLGATDAQIDGAGLEGVSAFIAANVAAPQAPAAPKADDTDPLDDFDFGVDETGKKLTKDYYDAPSQAFFRGIAKKQKALEAKIAEQEAASNSLTQRQQQAQQQAVDAQIDAIFAKHADTHKKVFTKATVGTLTDGEMQRRKAVIHAAQVMPGATWDEKIAAAVKAIHGDGTAATDKALAARTQQFKAGALQKPTSRNGSSDQKPGVDKARKGVREFFNALAQANASEDGDIDLDSLPD